MPLTAEYESSPWEPIATQVEQYEATGGVEGGTMQGAPCVILHTRGRRSGKVRTTPSIRIEHDGSYAAIASMGGAPDHPVWYLNLVADPMVSLQDRPDVSDYVARTVTGDEKSLWWEWASQVWSSYDDYQAATEREIPVVVLDPA